MVSYSSSRRGLAYKVGRMLGRGVKHVRKHALAYSGVASARANRHLSKARRMSRRNKRSYRKTRSRKPSDRGDMRVEDVSKSYFSTYKKGSSKTLRRWAKDGVNLKWTFITGLTYLSVVAAQAVNQLPVTLFTRTDIDTINTKLINLNPVSAGTAPIQMSTGLVSAKLYTSIKNQTNDEIEVWLYTVTPKFNLGGSDPTFLTAWDLGLDAQNNTSGVPATDPYSEPRMSVLVKNAWTVLRKQKYRMKSGSLVTDCFNYKPNKVMTEMYLQLYNDTAAYANLTVYSILVTLGPIGRKATTSVPTYAPCRVDVIQKVEYELTGHIDRLDLMTITNSLAVDSDPKLAMTDVDESSNAIVVVG